MSKVRLWIGFALVASCSDAKNTPPTKDQRAEAALARVEGMQARVAKLRELPLKQPVSTARQSPADFRKFLEVEIARDLPPAKSAKVSEAYFHLGLLAKRVDLATVLEQTMATQALAYYDPRAKRFFVVTVPENDMLLDTMSAHELVHGLQDQAFDLTKYLAPEPPLDDDAQTARQFITEGDASLAMYVYQGIEAGQLGTKAIVDNISPQLELASSMDLAAYTAAMKQQMSMLQGAGELQDAMAAADDLPAMVVWPLFDSYSRGALVALTAYRQGGWAAVDALYKHPPESTEQVLHPKTKLIPKRERPIRVTLPALEGEVLNTNLFGELQWRTYFSLWGGPLAASEGWGGDRYTVVKRPDGSVLGYHATIWDTAADAKEFETAYQASLAKRGERKRRVIADDTKVFLLDGSDDEALLKKLIEGTRFE